MFKKQDYSPYWRQFSEYVRFERAENRCECAGECGRFHASGRYEATNGAVGKLGMDGVWRTTSEIHNLNSCDGSLAYPNFDSLGSRVCLTTAHLDNEGGVCDCKARYGFKCAKPSHVLAMCQGCHLVLDRFSHAKKRIETISKRKDSERGLFSTI